MDSITEIENIKTEIKQFNSIFDVNNDEFIDFKKEITYFRSKHPYWRVYIKQEDREYNELYGQALVRYSYSLLRQNNSAIEEKDVRELLEKTEEYKTTTTKMWNIVGALYFNIGLGWGKIGNDCLAIDAFKHHIYYNIQKEPENRKQYGGFTFYAFRSCSDYVKESLANETINVSSPSTFNDIFDCPLLAMIQSQETELDELLYQAYNECLKIACFVGYRVKALIEKKKIKKNKNGVKEFMNPLMWAHYADSHKGICIEYKFPEKPLQNNGASVECCSTFKNVVYVNSLHREILKPIKNGYGINTTKAFFTKSKIWKYENEVRLLNVNVGGKGLHESIPVPNSIKAIYFGVNCPKEDSQMIKNILSNKNVIFYQMVKDDKHFGKIKIEK